MIPNIRVPSVVPTGRSGPFLSTLVLVGALVLGPGSGIPRCAAQSFPSVLTDEQTFSIGVVQIVVHDSRVTQIEKTERVRLDKPSKN